MKTRRFILYSTLLTLLLLAPLTLGGLLLPACYSDTYMGELPYKMARLREAEGKRLILIGGSGIAFAVDSSLLEEAFPDYTPVNLGMYADLGTSFLLDMTEGELREGDVVLLAPEQDPQTLSTYFGARSALQGMDGAWSLLRKVRRENVGDLFGALPAFSLEKWRYTISGEHPEGEGIYRRSSFNAYGDIESPLADANHMSGFYDAAQPVSYDPSVLSDAFVSRVRDYVSAAHRKGAEVLWYFCPADRLAVEDSASPDDFYDHICEALDLPVPGDPNNAVMDEAWFFDTNFHLNQSGRTVYTAQLIRDLKACFGITAPTDIPLPSAPALPASGGTVILVSQWAGNTEVSEITLPADTVRIEDHAFEGCSRLRVIRLQSSSPSRILVGDHLLDGCDALIYVPSGSLSAYRTDYRFSRYADRIREE